MSVHTLPKTVPLISSRNRMRRGRFDVSKSVNPLLRGYQMRPSDSRRSIVSLEYRHPLGGNGKPFHSYIIFGRGAGLAMSLKVYRRPPWSMLAYFERR